MIGSRSGLCCCALLCVAATAEARIVPVTSADALTQALAGAQPGDTIVVAAGSYQVANPLAVAASGDATNSLRLTSADPAQPAVLSAAQPTMPLLRVSGAFWQIDDLVLQGGSDAIEVGDGGSDLLLRQLTIRAVSGGGLKVACGGPATRPHCDRGRADQIDIAAASGASCQFIGVEIVGANDWALHRIAIHDVTPDAVVCPTPATSGLTVRANASRLTVDALDVRGTALGATLGPASDPCEVRDTVQSGASCTPPTSCAAQAALLSNLVVVGSSDDALLLQNACMVRLLNATLWNDGLGYAGRRSVETRVAATGELSNTILNSDPVYAMGAALAGSGNLVLPSPSDPSWFVAAAAGDLRLAALAPAIDKGVTLADVPFDHDGRVRPAGAGYDVGAFERPLGGYPDGGTMNGGSDDGGMQDGGAGDGGSYDLSVAGGGSGAGNGTTGTTAPPREPGCQCQLGGGAPGLGLFAVLLLVALLARRRRA